MIGCQQLHDTINGQIYVHVFWNPHVHTHEYRSINNIERSHAMLLKRVSFDVINSDDSCAGSPVLQCRRLPSFIPAVAAIRYSYKAIRPASLQCMFVAALQNKA